MTLSKLSTSLALAILAVCALGGCRSRAWVGAAPATAVPATATSDPAAIPDLAAPMGPGSTEPSGEVEAGQTPETATYNGVPLPSVGNIDATMSPPPAWLIAGQELVPATRGSYSVGLIHADMAPPHLLGEHLATASLPTGERAVVVVGSTEIAELGAWISPWGEDPSELNDPRTTQVLEPRGETRDELTIFTLEPPGGGSDALLFFWIQLANGDSASYLWRLNPGSKDDTDRAEDN